MTALILASAYLFLLTLNVAAARGGPVRMTERGSAVLIWLYNHPKPGTPRSRRRVERYFKRKVWGGLRLSGTLSGFLCVHSHEGPWTIHNPPYDGGLQMDSGFQLSYGGEYLRLWGAAGHWPPWAQVVAGYRAYRVRGWHPWPNTARMCGLL